MNTEYLSIQEASNATWKHINTIRGLIEKNKVQYTKDGKRYLILRESLAIIYRERKDEIENFWIAQEKNSNNNSINNHGTTDFNTQLKPLIDNLNYYVKEYQESQKLLTSSKEQELKLKQEHEEKLKSQKNELTQENIKMSEKFKKKMFNQKIIIYALLWAILFLLLVFLVKQWLVTIKIGA